MATVKSIRLERAEGPRGQCGVKEVASFAHASLVLGEWARTAPDAGGYDKCDFTVTWEDGEQYQGRVDLERKHSTGYDLRRHMREFLRFYTGEARPYHLTPEQYQRALAGDPLGKPEEIKAFLAKYLAEGS